MGLIKPSHYLYTRRLSPRSRKCDDAFDGLYYAPLLYNDIALIYASAEKVRQEAALDL